MDFSSSPESLEASVLSYPDFVVFDLDPNLKDTESTFDKPAFRKTVAVACELREYLDKLGMKAFLKTSGKTGLHLYIPIRREHPYDEVKAWAKAVGKEIESRCPEEVTMEWSLSKRPNKIFIDHNQNVRGKTLVAIYSTRPAVDAPVSFPVSWDDLEDIDPREFTMRTAPKLLQKQGDPWAGILKRPQTLKPLSKAYLG
jgi:bifunctional non-homologous end joining protein LigD